MKPKTQNESTLKDIEQDYRALLDAIEGIVWEADASSFQFSFVSAEAERLLGYPVSQWIEETDFWSNHVYPEDRRKTVESCLRSIASLEDNDMEYRMIASDGRIVWLRDIVSVRVENGIPRLRGVMIDITKQKDAEQKLDYLVNFDSLTDLPNRNLFIDRLDRALAYSSWHKRPLAVLAISIRRMKRINESLGREAGDQLLMKFAERLQSLLRSRDTTARLSGNEFAVLLADMSRKTDVGRIIEKLTDGLSRPFSLAGHDISPTVSIGISMPLNGDDDAVTLLGNAETAMHQLSNPVGVNYQHYSDSLGEQITSVLTIENALRRALAEQEFDLYYQPQVDLVSGGIVSVEALLRWPRADMGTVVMPSDFIPLAEESGLIIPIGKWVLQRACRDFQAWREHGVTPHLAINISARQFQGADLVGEIERILSDHDIQAGQLELELTESVLRDESASEQMHALADLGILIAIDDFGIGYSSLSYLKHLPVHKLKIDRSFLHDVPRATDNTAIIDAVIAMGHSMGLQVVAEGVETALQRDHLCAHGCDLGQGFLFSRPVRGEQLLQLMSPRISN